MNAPESKNTFVPRQALAPTPELYMKMAGDSMERMAAMTVSCMPPIPSGAKVHDIACGVGAATAAVTAATKDKDVSITATDINEGAIGLLRKVAVERGWSVDVQPMDATALTFADDTFTHTVANAVLFALLAGTDEAAVSVMKEIRRTLKPGGIVVTNSFAFIPNMVALHAAAIKTRPEGTPLPRGGMDRWNKPGFIRDIAIEAGFSPDKVTVEQREVFFTAAELQEFGQMAWSFMGGTGPAGWLQSDEANWDQAVECFNYALSQTEGFKILEDGNTRLRVLVNVLVATK